MTRRDTGWHIDRCFVGGEGAGYRGVQPTPPSGDGVPPMADAVLSMTGRRRLRMILGLKKKEAVPYHVIRVTILFEDKLLVGDS